MKNTLAVLDTETGGLDPQKNPITQLAAIAVEPTRFKELSRIDFYVKPYGSKWIIEDEALKRTQLKMRDILAGVNYKVACGNCIEFFRALNKGGKPKTRPIIIGHNIGFDIGMLKMLFELNGKDLYDYIFPVAFDTLKEVEIIEDGALRKDESSLNNLTAVCDRWGIKLRNAHGAMTDVLATFELFKKITNLKRTAYATTILNNGVSSKGGSGISEIENSERQKKARQSFRFEF